MIPTTYSIYLATPDGVRLGSLESFSRLTYGFLVNDTSPLTIELPAEDIPVTWLQRDLRIEVWRSLDGGPEYCDGNASFLLRGWSKYQDANGVQWLQLRGQRATTILSRRIVAYAADSSQAQKTSAADSMLVTIIKENFGTSATDTTRRVSLNIRESAGSAPSQTKAFAWRNVLPVLQEICQASTTAGTNLYFDIVRTDATALEFQTFLGLRGVDHSRTGLRPIIVSPESDSLIDPRLDVDYDKEWNAVYAGGQGLASQREIVSVVDAARANASIYGRIERFVNASSAASGSVTTEANSALRDGRPRRTFSGRIIDTNAARYGRDWGWGDRIIALYDGEELTCRIDAVSVTFENGTETITAALRAED